MGHLHIYIYINSAENNAYDEGNIKEAVEPANKAVTVI
jgi:hypothetical protein